MQLWCEYKSKPQGLLVLFSKTQRTAHENRHLSYQSSQPPFRISLPTRHFRGAMHWHLVCICSAFQAYTTMESLVFMLCLFNQAVLLLVLLGSTPRRSRTAPGPVYVAIAQDKPSASMLDSALFSAALRPSRPIDKSS